MESIDALAKAVNEFEGGMILVSHDMRLIGQVAKEIWICDNKTIEKYKGDISSFKLGMRKQMGLQGEQKLLRGDFSEKVKDKVLEKGFTISPTETKSKPVAAVALELKAMKIEDDEATASTASTSVSTKASLAKKTASPVADPATDTATTPSAPANRYIPPHLRKKMLEEQKHNGT
jgi:ABC-type sulfate/molybdate transport systems ATPase subunit